MSLELVIVLGLATYRLARAVAIDDITEGVRSWFYRRTQWGYRLVSCAYCIGFWIAAAVTLAWVLATDWPGTVEWLILWWAVAGAGAIASSIDLRLLSPH